MAEIVQQLEMAAKVFLSPPSAVSADERHQAETFFLDFRKTPNPFPLCRTILESCQHPYVQFEAVNLLKDGLLRDWKQLPADAVSELQTYLLNYAITQLGLEAYVRERVVQTVAILVKRCSVEDKGVQRADFLTNVQQLIRSSDINMQLLGCSLISALLQEHANTLKSADVLLTWEQHFIAKKQFETTDLKSVFEFCLSTLLEAERLPSFSTPSQVALVEKLLNVTEAILSWTFTSFNIKSQRLVAVFETEQSPSLRPGVQWRELMLNPDVVSLFFKMYWKVRNQERMVASCLNCISQLCTLNGTVMGSKEARVKYAAHVSQHLLTIISDESLPADQYLPVATIIQRYVVFFPAPTLVNLPRDAEAALVGQLAQFTCRMARCAAAEEQTVCDADHGSRDAFSRLLEAWAMLLQDSCSLPTAVYATPIRCMLETYLQTHLAPPEGTRGKSADADDECEDVEETDRVLFRDQLVTMGIFGRITAADSVPTLTRLLENQTCRLQQLLLHVHGASAGSGTASSGPAAELLQRLLDPAAVNAAAAAGSSSAVQSVADAQTALLQLYEDVHWTLLIAGHVLALDSRGEAAMIPSLLNSYSETFYSGGSGGVDPAVLPATAAALRVAGSAQQHQALDKVDPVVRLVCCGVRLLELLRSAAGSGLSSAVSPEVVSTALWFLQRITPSYLMPNERHYGSLSLSLLSAFGGDSESGRWLVGFILGLVGDLIRFMCSEPAVVDDCVQLLDTLCYSRQRGSTVIQCERLTSVVSLVAGGCQEPTSALPPAAQRGLVRCLVAVASATPDPAVTQLYLAKLLTPLRSSFVSVISAPNFKSTYQDELVTLRVISLLECFIGVSQGSQVQNTQHLFPVLLETLTDTLSLLHVYRNHRRVFELVMQLYAEAARRLLCFLKSTESKAFYESCLSMMRLYTRYQGGLRALTAASASTAEEDSYTDLMLLMDLLTSMLSKDIIDLGGHDDSSEEGSVCAADVSLYGLGIVMPLMSAELLRFPALCLRYYKLIAFICEVTPHKIVELPSELLESMLASVRLGLVEFGADASGLALEFLHQLATCAMFRRLPADHPVPRGLQPFLRILLDIILSNSVAADVLQAHSGAFFSLICCFQDEYRELVTSLISRQSDEQKGQRLAGVFTQLTSSLQLTIDRTNRLAFREAFKEFLVEIRGFMMVK